MKFAFQFRLRTLFWITAAVAVVMALVRLVLPLSFRTQFVLYSLLYGAIALVIITAGWMLQSRESADTVSERGSDLVSIGLLMLLVLPAIWMAVFAFSQ